MRRGELLALNWQYVQLNTRTCYLPVTKNRLSRTLPLSAKAFHILCDFPRSMDGRVFSLTTRVPRGLWNRDCRRAGIIDLHFHDLRHEATSRLSEKGLNVVEVATITGHKDLRILHQYTHLRVEDLAEKFEWFIFRYY